MVVLQLSNRVRRIETFNPLDTAVWALWLGRLQASAQTGSDQAFIGGLDFGTVFSSTKGRPGDGEGRGIATTENVLTIRK
jgi:hypothetical protein